MQTFEALVMPSASKPSLARHEIHQAETVMLACQWSLKTANSGGTTLLVVYLGLLVDRADVGQSPIAFPQNSFTW